MCKVSVVIPIYNVDKYLTEAIKSIISQTYKNIEIILVNDGSTDKSLSIAKEFSENDNRIILVNQKNVGLSGARNKGLSIATGKYVYFFDSDDILETNCIKTSVKISEENNLDVLIFSAKSFGGNINYNNKYSLEGIVEEGSILKGTDFLKKNTYIPSVCTKFIRKSVLDSNNINFIEGILHEDQGFTPMLLLKSENVMYLNKYYFNRRIRANSITTSTFTNKNLEGYYKSMIYLKKYSSKKELKFLNNVLKANIKSILFVSKKIEDNMYINLVMKEFKPFLTLKDTIYIKSPKFYNFLRKVNSLKEKL